ncbi:hypothetical protein F5882DRAFT_445693 [Hyaloscypha sp. PMI_1271]|nr:hypothetical protein F5882DRAFT_445693 [Hyaloscypha sp. PMI_1271]
MPKLVHKCPGRNPREPKTSRKEGPVWQRSAIVNSTRSSKEEAEIWADPPVDSNAVAYTESGIRKLRQRARKRWESTGTRNGARRAPLADISNVVNTPGRGAPTKITPRIKKLLIAKVVESREERQKTAQQHCSEFKISHDMEISPESFTQVMYDNGYSRRGVAKKPKLTPDHRKLRVSRAKILRKIVRERPELLAFLDAASIRLHEEEEIKCWHRADEWEHPDVKTNTERSDYSCGQFFGIIAHSQRPGPSKIFVAETEEEKADAQRDLAERNIPYDKWYGFVFDVAAEAERLKYEKEGRKKPGKPASKEIYLQKKHMSRGDRSNGGVDCKSIMEKTSN